MFNNMKQQYYEFTSAKDKYPKVSAYKEINKKPVKKVTEEEIIDNVK